jgi:hypothetical protein
LLPSAPPISQRRVTVVLLTVAAIALTVVIAELVPLRRSAGSGAITYYEQLGYPPNREVLRSSPVPSHRPHARTVTSRTASPSTTPNSSPNSTPTTGSSPGTGNTRPVGPPKPSSKAGAQGGRAPTTSAEPIPSADGSTPAPVQPQPTSPTASPTSSPSTTPTTSPGPVGGLRLVFDEEFNGTSVDLSKWNVRNNFHARNEASMMTNRQKNVWVHDGVLDLRAWKENWTSPDGHTSHYTSGYLDTIGKQSFRYGRFEMRAKLPPQQGMWPAFWLRDDHKLGEIDIMEAVGGMPNFTAQSIHQSTNADMEKRAHDNFGSSPMAQWHVYTLDFEPHEVTWYIDGKVVFRVTSANTAWLTDTFNDTVNIRLNLQVDGTMPAYYGYPVNSTTTYPSVYTIDYIRVYQH